MANKNGATPLHIAAFNGKLNYFKSILFEFNNHYFVVYSGHQKFVELLIKNGANVSLADKNGRTALHYAADSGMLITL